MQPTFQTSFIPKKPIVSEGGNNRFASSTVVRDVNAISIIATIIFTVTVLATGGLFFYKMYLNKQITQLDSEINTARSAFQIDKIKELLDANDRILASKVLLDNHVTVSKLLYLFQDLTVKRMRLLRLTYSDKSGIPGLTAKAQVQTYNALVEQSKILSDSAYLKNSQFLNFGLADNGIVNVDFISSVDRSLLSYKKAIEESSQTESAPVAEPNSNQ